jgi:hypothetical protein
MIELVTFILVLTVFLVAYGIVSQGLLYLQRKSDWIIHENECFKTESEVLQYIFL